LLAPNHDGVLFIEANAIRHSPIIEKLLRCKQTAGGGKGLTQLSEAFGIDLTEAIDRIGVTGGAMVVSGFFSKLKLPEALGSGTPYGDRAVLYEAKDKGSEPTYFAQVGDELLLTGNRADVLAAIDRAEGRAAAGAPLPERLSSSEVYGTVDHRFIQRLLSQSTDPQTKRFAQLIQSATLRMSVDEAVATSIDVTATDPASAEDLAKATSAAFAVLRQDAAQSGDSELAQLLEQARAQSDGQGMVNLDLAMPGEVLLKIMGCAADGNPLPTSRGPPAAGPP
jgi:hypothetical protein